ncbi:Oxoglutarate/iron-dependent dioxygenase, partial [Corchorus olitorius]
MDIGATIAETVGLDGNYCKEWPCQYRISRYNFTPEALGSTGLQMHTDSGFLTILQDDENVGGLAVMYKSGEFVAVDPLPGSLLVTLGDMAA